MKVPLSWLREFVDLDLSAEEGADKLSSIGLSVEQLIHTGQGVEGVRVGRVLEVRDHPTSNKPLVLVKADVGEAETLDIVCGARNFAAGDLVAVAVPGARLPDGMQIVKRKLAGETSNGMLCSARELGVSQDHSGILVLPAVLTVGDDVRVALQLDDAIFDIEITPNRPDCLCVLGVARELAASLGLSLNDPLPKVSESKDRTSSLIAVDVQDETGCPRYIARVITGVEHVDSPWWMKRRLLACGMRPINAIVDVTNYVMLERGQPLHAFDVDRMHGGKVIVRAARPSESLTTLDGIERKLTPDDLVIADDEMPLAIAGVMGSTQAEVGEGTSNVLIESAYFTPVRVLRTARRLGLRTEASVRFERGIDPEGAGRAADRAISLLSEIASGNVAAGRVEAGPGIQARESIALSESFVRRLLGVALAGDEMTAILSRLGFDLGATDRIVSQVDDSRYGTEQRGHDVDFMHSVTAPTWRPDISNPSDLAEEIARHFGYDRIPVSLPEGGRRGGLNHLQSLRRIVRRAVLGAGLSEAQTLSLITPKFPDRLSLPSDHPWRNTISLLNPLSEEESVLRPSLLPGLLLAAERNVARRAASVAVFEIGVTFTPTEEAPAESLELAWVMAGARPISWHEAPNTFDFYDASGAVSTICDSAGIENVVIRPAALGAPYHPARCAEILLNGNAVGCIAELHPRAASALDLPDRVAVGFVRLEPLLATAHPARRLALARFPGSTRDIALVVSDDVVASDISAVISEAAGDLLESVEPFDVYRSEQVGPGNHSIAFSLVFRHPDRTLTDSDVEEVYAALVTACNARGWAVRD